MSTARSVLAAVDQLSARVRVLEFPEGSSRAPRVGGLLIDILGASAELLHVFMLPDFERVDAIGSYADAAGKAGATMLVW